VYNGYRRSTGLQGYSSSTVVMQGTWVAQLYWGSTGVLDMSRVQDNRSSTGVHGTIAIQGYTVVGVVQRYTGT